MNSKHYEQLARRAISENFDVPIADIKSGDLPSPRTPDNPEYTHQIDLYWDTGPEAARYFHIANAKWRGTDKVKQGDVELLEQVKQSVRAHKAVMVTSVGFTKGARAVAVNYGIALHVVAPTPGFSFDSLPKADADAIQAELARLEGEGPLFSLQVVHRAAPQPAQVAARVPAQGYQNRMVSPAAEKRTATVPGQQPQPPSHRPGVERR